MDIKVYPGKLKGTVQAPPSKSAAHRALICASLADGTSIIRGISGSKDMKATIGCMSALGAQIERIDDHSVRIVGISAARGVDDDAMCSAGEDAVCGVGEDAVCGAGEGVVCGAGEDAVCGVGEGAVCGTGEDAACGAGEGVVCGAGEDAVCGVGEGAVCGTGEDAACGAGEGVVCGAGEDAVCGVGEGAVCGTGEDAACGAGEGVVCGAGEDAVCGVGEGAVCGTGEDAACGAGEGVVCGAGEDAVCGVGEGAVCGTGEDAACGAGEGVVCGAGEDAVCGVGEGAVCGTGEDAACGAGEGVVCGAGEDAVCGVGEGAVCGAGEGAVCGTGEDAVCSAGEDAVCGADNNAMCNDNGSRVVLDCIESGSTLRFVLPIAAALGADAHFVGQGKLPERPMTPLADEMKKKGIIFSPDGRDCLPFDIHGKLEAGIFKIPGNISSQYFSGLIFALPLLNADSEIVVDGNLESKGYIDLTLKMVEDFGIRIIKTDSGFKVPGNQTYKASDIEIEGDYSQAAFWFVAGALGSDIKVTGLRLDSAQGDKEAVDVLAGFGANVLKSDLQNNDDDIYVCNTKEISRKVNDGSDGSAASDARSTEKDARSTEKDARSTEKDARSAADKMHAADETHTADKMHAADETHTADKMHAADVDSSDIPDVIPVLSVAAACCNGTSTFYNAGRLRLKECDRLSAMAVSLKKLGIEASETENELIVTGGRLRGGCEVSGFNDHRIVMSMAIAALSCEEPVIITGVEAISKSYPDFFDEFRRLGGRADVITDRKDS